MGVGHLLHIPWSQTLSWPNNHFDFAGTYSTQPAVTVQTFGHKYGGFIYAFLFSGDIINNLITALMSRVSKVVLLYCNNP